MAPLLPLPSPPPRAGGPSGSCVQGVCSSQRMRTLGPEEVGIVTSGILRGAAAVSVPAL